MFWTLPLLTRTPYTSSSEMKSVPNAGDMRAAGGTSSHAEIMGRLPVCYFAMETVEILG